MEIFKKIVGHEKYSVSTYGRVRNDETGQIIQPYDVRGYKVVSLYGVAGCKKVGVHRLVAEAFVPNPNSLPIINHKDEQPSNNHVNNLEWCTYSYNVNYGTGIQRARVNNPKCNPVVVDGIRFDSIRLAAAQFDFSSTALNNALKAGKSTCKGHSIGYSS